MSYDLTNLLVVAISSTALFENRKEHDVYLKKSLDDYIDHQISHENEPFKAGAAMPLIRALLRLNELVPGRRLVEVVILSNMEPEVGVRVMNSVEHHKLDITRSAFIGGEPVAKYLDAYNVKLFLSRSEKDVQEALDCGVAAGLLYDPPVQAAEDDLKQLRIAFDGDAVIFSDDSEQIFQEQGIDAFYRHEKANAENPMAAGPFASFLRAIAEIQKECRRQGGEAPIRTALVTARSSPAHKRVILTLRAWGIRIDEMFFMGGVSKDQILKQFNPHIFFDDQHAHAGPASEFVPSARVLTPRLKTRKANEG
ncbi:MAG: 5'-nucleotidase [Kiritimatiellia bacterium]